MTRSTPSRTVFQILITTRRADRPEWKHRYGSDCRPLKRGVGFESGLVTFAYSFRQWRRQSDAPQQVLKPGIRSNGVQQRFDLEFYEIRVAFLVSFFKPGERLIALSQ